MKNDLNGYKLWQGKIIRELMVILIIIMGYLFELANVADEVKYFSLMHDRRRYLTFLLLQFILDHIFGPKKDNLFCPVFVFHRGMSNSICDLVLYLKTKGLKISWISRCSSILVFKNGIRNTVFYSVSSWTSLYFF